MSAPTLADIARTIDAAREPVSIAPPEPRKTPPRHAREIVRHSAGIPKPRVIFSYCEGSLF